MATATLKSIQNTQLASLPQIGFGRIIMWTVLFQLAWNWGALRTIINEGMMRGPDDYMRLFQVRSLMAGQSWFDSTAYRMLPPTGADIHWSRIVDGPIAGLIYLLSPIFEQQLAERITTILWPTILLVFTVLLITKICDSLFSSYNRLLPVFFTVLCVSSLAQFVPGRIDHHNVQILLFVCLLWCLVNWDRPLANILAGIIVPFSISIGLDVLIFSLLFMAWFGMEWAFGADRSGKALRRFAISLATATLLLYPLNIGYDKWFVAWCDANSIVFFTAQMSIAASLFIMSAATPLLAGGNVNSNIAMRLGLGAALAIASISILLTLFPQCLNGPFSAVSEELNTKWLSEVSEAKSLITVLQDYPEYWIKTVAYSVLMFFTGIWVLRHKLENKTRLMIIFAAFVASVLLTFIQYRTIRIGFFAAIPIGVLATELITSRLAEKYGKGSMRSMVGQVASVFILSTFTWGIIGSLLMAKPAVALPATNLTNDSTNSSEPVRSHCFFESDYKLLASLPKGNVLSDLTSAPAVLIYTDKNVFTGPYHRNGRAILDVFNFFLTDTDIPRQIAVKQKTDYVALCRSPIGGEKWQENEGSLKNRLLLDDVPDWLERLSGENDKMLVFRVKK